LLKYFCHGNGLVRVNLNSVGFFDKNDAFECIATVKADTKFTFIPETARIAGGLVGSANGEFDFVAVLVDLFRHCNDFSLQ
jgi:hypothetical protein